MTNEIHQDLSKYLNSLLGKSVIGFFLRRDIMINDIHHLLLPHLPENLSQIYNLDIFIFLTAISMLRYHILQSEKTRAG